MKKSLIALALVAAAGGAHADVMTQSDSFGYQTTNWTYALGGLSQFDGSLGTLNSVIISLTGSINQSLVAENIGGSADALTPVAGGTLRFRQGGSVVLNQVLPTTSGTTFFATAFDGTDDKAGTSGVNFGILSASASNTVTLTDPADLAGFIGAGFLSNYDLRAIGNGMIESDNGNISQIIQTEAMASVTLSYEYTKAQNPDPQPVPEPASMALIGLGALGLAAVRRRK